MKKTALTLAAMAAFASASAFGIKEPAKLATPPGPEARIVEIPVRFAASDSRQSALSRAENSEALYMPAEAPYQLLGFDNQIVGMQSAMAMQMDPSFVNSMAGAEITRIQFYTGSEYGGHENRIRRATVFVTNDLTAEPLLTQETACPAEPTALVDVTLDTPCVIEAGKKVYVGVYMTLNSPNNLPIVIDFTGHSNDFGGWIGARSAPSEQWTWNNITAKYGFVCVGATVKGEFPVDNVSVTDIDGVPVSYQNEPFEVDFLFKNNGSNDVNTLALEYDIDGEGTESGTVTMTAPVPFNKSAVIRLTDIVAPKAAKKANVNVRVTAVNGKPNTSADNSASFPVTIVPAGKGFDRNVVIEEFTSTTCAYCPVGYTGMEYIHENYTDGDLIPVAIHVNYPGRDPMTATTFNNVYNLYCSSGVPSAIANRAYDVYPTSENLVKIYEAVRSLPAIAKVTAEASYNPETGAISVDTRTAFSFDYAEGEHKFTLSYAVTENNVGPYTQNNGYAGQTGDYYGWQDLPSSVSLVYNDVARQLDKFTGIEGSVPAAITAGSEYAFSHDVTLLQTLNKPAKQLNIVVYLINKSTGEIENAAMVGTSAITGLAGVENVTADNGAASDIPAEYYNLQGQRLANPAPGTLVIRRQGATATKVVL